MWIYAFHLIISVVGSHRLCLKIATSQPQAPNDRAKPVKPSVFLRETRNANAVNAFSSFSVGSS